MQLVIGRWTTFEINSDVPDVNLGLIDNGTIVVTSGKVDKIKI